MRTDRRDPIGRWLRAQLGGDRSWHTPIQAQVALALIDPTAPRRCSGLVAVTADGGWTCTGACDGPPLDRHEVGRVHLCTRGLVQRPCICPRCARRDGT